MKKILMAAAVVLVSGTPLAFAVTSGNMSTSEPNSRSCSYLGEQFDLCKRDSHKNGGAQATDGGLSKSRSSGAARH
jgi:hypothetical protein